MRGLTSLVIVVFAWATIALLGCAVDDEEDIERASDSSDPTPDIPPVSNQPDDDEITCEEWGIWHGVWTEDHFEFEEVLSPGTISPVIRILADGTVAVLSLRKTWINENGASVPQNSLHLIRRLPNGEWQTPLTLATMEYGSQQAAMLPDEDGTLNILYSHEGIPTHLIVKENIVTAGLMQAGPEEPQYFSLAYSPWGKYHAVFGNWDLSHQMLLGGTWHVIREFPDGSYPDLAFATLEKNVVEGRLVYLRSTGVINVYTLFHYTWSGLTWEGQAVLPEIDFYARPHLSIDEEGRSTILVPSSEGLLYLVQDPSLASGWRKELVAGTNWRVGHEYADLVTANHIPFVAFRDAQTAKGWTGYRVDGAWKVGELEGFETGFIGMDLAIDANGVSHLVFAGTRVISD